MEDYNESLEERPSTKIVGVNPGRILFDRKFGTEDPTPQQDIGKPLPFDDDTLAGEVDYKTIARALMTFGDTELEYRDKD